jgi:hypothetical protein
MWEQKYSVTVSDIEPFQIWKIWSDIQLRPKWDDDTEWAKMEGDFSKNAVFYMKIKNGPKLKMKITECTIDQSFTDTYHFFLAQLDGVHSLEKTTNGLRINTTIKISGPLQWFWKKMVGEKIVKTLPHQTNLLIQLAREIT